SDWNKANEKFWPFSIFAKNRLIKQLAALVGTKISPRLEVDLPYLKSQKAILDLIDPLSPRLVEMPGWSGLNSNIDLIEKAVGIAQLVRQAIARISVDTDQLIELRKRVQDIVVNANDMLVPEGAMVRAHIILHEALSDFSGALSKYRELGLIEAAERSPL